MICGWRLPLAVGEGLCIWEGRRAMGRMVRPEDPEDVVWDERLGAEIPLYGRDRGTRERRRRGEVIEVGWRGVRHAEDVHASRLAYYRSRRLLSDSPYAEKRSEENVIRGIGAVRFLRDWERGGRRPRVTGRYDGMPIGRPGVCIGDLRSGGRGLRRMRRWVGGEMLFRAWFALTSGPGTGRGGGIRGWRARAGQGWRA